VLAHTHIVLFSPPPPPTGLLKAQTSLE
jgi:hypothetical protein